MSKILNARNGKYIEIDNRQMMIFCSNDYLALSYHPATRQAAFAAADRYGVGTGGAPGTSGMTDIHKNLQKSIAEFKKRERAILFPSGYAANSSLHQSLGCEECCFFSDSMNHPSTADGIKLSGSELKIFEHKNYDQLEKLLHETKAKTKIVTTCSVFTIDGGIADLLRLKNLKDKFDCALILDEAHATGCLGTTGRGLEEHYNLNGQADYIMGTFSKALGSQGGFVTCDDRQFQSLKLPLKAHTYSTSLATPSAAAALKAIELIKTKPELIEALHRNSAYIRDKLSELGLDLNDNPGHITNIYFESESESSKICRGLFEAGYLVVPIHIGDKYGIRITVMITHKRDEIDGFVEIIGKLTKQKK